MNRPHSREQETRELIRRFETRRARRRRLHVLLACVGGAVLIALIVTVVALATRDGGGDVASSSTTAVSAEVTKSTTIPEPPTTWVPGTGGPASTTTLPVPTTVPPATSPQATSTTSTLPTSTSSTLPTTTSTSTTAPQTTGFVVVVDPGHQARGDPDLEPDGPGSTRLKPKVSSGTAGVATGTPESELVLAVGLKLRDALESHGIRVVMTRTTQDVNISNIQRAQVANEAGADLFVRVHADGSDNPDVNGIHVLYPPPVAGWTDDIAEASKRAAVLAQTALIAATGAKDRGIDPRDDMTGFNWSDVPVILPEIGFMTNPAEDRLLASPSYQDKIVQALTGAILTFLGVS